MKPFKVAVLLIVLLFCTGCKDYGERRIVKLITANKENVTLYFYDYSLDDMGYDTCQVPNKGLENTFVEILSDAQYDLKLCQYVVVDKEIVSDCFPELFNGLMNAKFSPDIAIIEGKVDDDSEKYIQTSATNYPLYTYKKNNDVVNGVIENVDNRTKNIMVNNKLYKTLNEEESFLVDLLSKKLSKGTYNFQHQDNAMSANLENIMVYYGVSKNVLHIEVIANLQTYKGLPSGKENKQRFSQLLQQSMTQEIEKIYEDNVLVQEFNLKWYKKVKNFDEMLITVRIV